MQLSCMLILNCGSSSIKFAIIDPKTEQTHLSGMIERINESNAHFTYQLSGQKKESDLKSIGYEGALQEIFYIIDSQPTIKDQLMAVGHRVVHGGEYFSESVVIDEAVIEKIEASAELAPLHNPANLKGIRFAQEQLPDLPQVAIFDTAFHQTMPDYAFHYAIPSHLYSDYAIRRYGFHGTSHRYVTREAARILNRDLKDSAFVSAHLGNGCSIAAVLNGESVDTSMGLTPLAGLMMGTRSGDVDPGLHQYLSEKLDLSIQQVTQLLNKQSGILGISESFSDMRNLIEAVDRKNPQAILAFEMFCYRVAKYIASYIVPLGRIDALIFTAGIGEHAAPVRSKVLNWLRCLNFKTDESRNERHGKDSKGVITQEGVSPIAMVIATNEELVMSQEILLLIKE